MFVYFFNKNLCVGFLTDVLIDSKLMARHRVGPNIPADISIRDLSLALKNRWSSAHSQPAPRDKLMQLSNNVNSQALQVQAGFPQDGALLSPNTHLDTRRIQKKLQQQKEAQIQKEREQQQKEREQQQREREQREREHQQKQQAKAAQQQQQSSTNSSNTNTTSTTTTNTNTTNTNVNDEEEQEDMPRFRLSSKPSIQINLNSNNNNKSQPPSLEANGDISMNE